MYGLVQLFRFMPTTSLTPAKNLKIFLDHLLYFLFISWLCPKNLIEITGYISSFYWIKSRLHNFRRYTKTRCVKGYEVDGRTMPGWVQLFRFMPTTSVSTSKINQKMNENFPRIFQWNCNLRPSLSWPSQRLNVLIGKQNAIFIIFAVTRMVEV